MKSRLLKKKKKRKIKNKRDDITNYSAKYIKKVQI